MKRKSVLVLTGAILLSFFIGYSSRNIDLYESAKNFPRNELNIPAQWFIMMNSMGEWEKMMLIFGYADNVDVCLHLVKLAETETPKRDFRCTDAN